MQSHASRHVVSERLQDLHPDLSPPFLKEILRDEIAVAYGRRGIQKLIAVLAMEPADLTDDQRAHALRVFNSLLTTQEHKTDAISSNAAAPLTRLVRESPCLEVRQLSCQALASLALVRPGRQAVVQAQGMASLTQALTTTPEAAADALRQFSTCTDGVAHLAGVFETVVPALVQVLNSAPGTTGVTVGACEHAVAALGGMAVNDEGVEACLKHAVPQAVVHLMKRCMTGDFRLEGGMTAALQACCMCLEQLAHHPQGKTDLRQAGAIQELGEVLVQCAYQPSCLIHATAAIMGCSVEKESKVPCVMHAGKHLVHYVEAFYRLTHSGSDVACMQSSRDERLVANARAALMSCCEHLEARGAVTELLGERNLKELLYRGPLPATPPDFRYMVINPSGSQVPAWVHH